MKSDNKREARACEYRKAGKETSGSEGDICFSAVCIFSTKIRLYSGIEKRTD